MKSVRIYQPGPLALGVRELSPEAAQHVGTVLRMQESEIITLFCGDNHEYSAVISQVQKKKVVVDIQSSKVVNRESLCKIHLGQAISKGERMEWVIQKAVELGVHSVTPLITERCVVRLDLERLEKKQNQWQAIAISACEQSGRNTIPQILPPAALTSYFQIDAAVKLVLDPKSGTTCKDLNLAKPSVALLIGPEGGLTSAEIQQSLQQGFQGLSLGPRILRTETAALAALSVLQALAGDL